MNNSPLVSIIVPCRNEENFISKCLDTIIANDYPKNRLEVLVVDGMSEDGTREIVERNNCGICVDPLDPKEIAKAIEFLITHPEEARKMGQNGQKAVKEKYNWEREGEKLLKLYEELLKR